MLTILEALFLCLQAQPAEDKEECKKAIDAFHAACRGGTDAARIGAVDALAKHKCPNAVAALAPLLTADTDPVRIAAAKAIGGIDHPKSLEALTQALPANEGSRNVFDAIAKALQTLDWEAGAEPLHGLLTKYHEKGMVEELKVIIPVLGSLGSPSSVDPLLKLLEHAENESKASRAGKVRTAANPKLAGLEKPIHAALQAITGGSEPNHQKWHEYWSSNRERLLAGAVIVYRCKATGKRWEQKASEAEACPNHDKPEHDGQPVKTRLHARS